MKAQRAARLDFSLKHPSVCFHFKNLCWKQCMQQEFQNQLHSMILSCTFTLMKWEPNDTTICSLLIFSDLLLCCRNGRPLSSITFLRNLFFRKSRSKNPPTDSTSQDLVSVWADESSSYPANFRYVSLKCCNHLFKGWDGSQL